ncbi:hypothetical protein MauCBS54593_006649 [Microsporum audouinii]
MDFLSRSRRITYSPHPLTSFRATQSETWVNPQSHSIIEDCLIARVKGDTFVSSTSLPARKLPLNQLSDEELLARFTHGFFGGMLFATERFILTSGVWRLMAVQIKGLGQTNPLTLVTEPTSLNLQPPKDIWSAAEIPTTTLLPLHSRLFGSFQVTDSRLVGQTQQSLASTITSKMKVHDAQKNYSYIDFGFGSGNFAGCHRLSVHRQRSVDDISPGIEGTDPSDSVIEFRLSHFHCNPTGGKLHNLSILESFHQIYAKLLFTDALRLLC